MFKIIDFEITGITRLPSQECVLRVGGVTAHMIGHNYNITNKGNIVKNELLGDGWSLIPLASNSAQIKTGGRGD